MTEDCTDLTVGRVAAWRRDLANNNLTWSNGLCDLFDIDVNEFDGGLDALLARVHPDDRQLWRDALGDVRAVIGHEPLRLRIVRKDKSARIIQVDRDVFVDADSHPVSLTGVARDVTEIELASQLVRESEEHFRTLSENILDGVALIVDGIIEYANPAWLTITGHSPKEIMGHSPLEFVAPEERDRAAEGLKVFLRGESDGTSTNRAIKKDGTGIIVEVRLRLVQRAGRQAILAVGRGGTPPA